MKLSAFTDTPEDFTSFSANTHYTELIVLPEGHVIGLWEEARPTG